MKVRRKDYFEALQFVVTNWRECEAFDKSNIKAIGNWKHENDVMCLQVGPHHFLQGTPRITVMSGDWLLRDSNGQISVCRYDDFVNTYEEVE